MSSTLMVPIMGVHIADMLIGITPKKEGGTSMEVFVRNENHKGAMMNV